MRNNIRKIAVTFIIVVLLGIVFLRPESSFAANDLDSLEDGVYSLDYVILHAETESVSIANDYFEKPAFLIVKGDEHYIRFELNHSEWTKELQSPLGDSFVDVHVISEDKEKNTRIVQFKVDRDLKEPVEFKMHVLIESMDPVYDHRYTVRFSFDLESLKELEEKEIEKLEIKETDFVDQEQKTEAAEAKDNTNSEAKSDSETKYNTVLISVTITVVVLLALFILIIWRNKNKKDKENVK
ncbi:NEAT domain-containing protein [Bacillus norwichensis]|uniref:NEAT domain-containing protein n=1 Tax=Bacillus norwichensis TaxID=2762217 RepID=A0ABR8VHB6_9BACI|nr:NEAT domain-containing protein [Bacillus norwichensis]MBD8004171.1 NEAT domain-containing protein [Bacillus norwichensis]